MRFVTLLTAALALCACDDFAEKLQKDFKHSAAYTPLANTISLNQGVNDALGAPFTFGDAKLTNIDKERHTITCDIQLSGPKGKGHAVVTVAQPEEKKPWVSKGGDFFPEAGPPIHLQPR